jgi:two-component system OmpR family response regulator/two-component system response regulator QseB
MTVASILIIEDNQDLAANIADYLESHGYLPDVAQDGITGLHLAVTNRYDAIVLDLMLPGMDGLSVCRRLRQDARSAVPVLMLTARSTLDDKEAGYAEGADDYLVKPFELEEMSARIRAAVRRGASQASNVLAHAGIALDLETRQASLHGQPVALTAREYHVLLALLQRRNGIVTRAQIEESLYGWGEEVESNAIEVYIHNLRKKFGSDSIVTVRGLGYRLKEHA